MRAVKLAIGAALFAVCVALMTFYALIQSEPKPWPGKVGSFSAQLALIGCLTLAGCQYNTTYLHCLDGHTLTGRTCRTPAGYEYPVCNFMRCGYDGDQFK